MASGVTVNLCLIPGAGQRIRIRCREANGDTVDNVQDWPFTATITDADGDIEYEYTNGSGITFDVSAGNSDAWIQITAAQTENLTVDGDYKLKIMVTPTGREPQCVAGGIITVKALPHDQIGGEEPDILAYLDGPVTVDATTTLPGSPGEDGADGAAGAAGADGRTVLYGTAAPTTEGQNGDFYIRTTTNYIYGPKSAGVWPSGTSLIGPTGATGAAGAAGVPALVTLDVSSDDQVYSAAVNTRVIVINSGYRFQVRMPSSPAVGDMITFVDASAQWGHITASYTGVPTVGTGADQSGGQQFGATFRFERFYLALPDSVKSYTSSYDFWTQTTPANRQREITFVYRTNNTEIADAASPAWFLVIPPDNRQFGDTGIAYVSPAGFDAANAVTPGEAWPRTGDRNRPYISANDAINAGKSRIHFLADDPTPIAVTGYYMDGSTPVLMDMDWVFTSDSDVTIGSITVNPADASVNTLNITSPCASVTTGDISFVHTENEAALTVNLLGLRGNGSTITLVSGPDGGSGGGTLSVVADEIHDYGWVLTSGATDGSLIRRFSHISTADTLTNVDLTDQGVAYGSILRAKNFSGAGGSLTGLDANNLTSGTTAIARGGTGAGTAVAAFNALHAEGSTIASASTTNLASATGTSVTVSGTTTINALGTVAAGAIYELTFSGTGTITHNGTSLILPGAANITRAAGDTAVFKSLGSGNWRCIAYQRGAAAPPSGTNTGDQTNISGNAATASAVAVGGITGLGTGVSTLLGTAANGSAADGPGYRGVPANAQTASYTLVMADAGKHIYHDSGAGSGDTYTIPANASVAFPVGTAVTFVNMDSNSVTIAITSDTLYLAGTGTTGSRTLAQYGIATAIKLTSTTWIISGSGLT